MEFPLDRYYTLMIIPEKNKDVRSIKIPRLVFKSIVFLFITFSILLGILTYDYWNVLSQVYENKHLLVENRQLKEQVQLFQMKLNSITEDLERINVFERKLRAITGLEAIQPTTVDAGSFNNRPNTNNVLAEPDRDYTPGSMIRIFKQTPTKTAEKLEKFEDDKKFVETKKSYEEKIASAYVDNTDVTYSKEWSFLTRQSLSMAPMYAEFDYKYDVVVNYLKEIEVRVHQLDQHLLDKESFLRSTPTIMPTAGHLTSSYGPRMSPYAGRVKMHEGIDVGAPSGTSIVAPADGVITYAGAKSGFGNFVQIDHGYGVETIYGHASTVTVKRGQKVVRGDRIATIGNTGYSTGPHVHYEVRVNGTPVDPLYYTLN
ncbi:peptidoglycan DD-metalloendopeptidase family protein [Bacteriovorax sp. PP10]|jgi:murein DD-endopeptidase MepM/ murein hydrolase activator NlpD|uniref:Peptidoglycan DD-metalloendopeptidase family protein n=1 Tax=Bacteriovorax antarcticus TaxID=3088717 RepID=A0ABU5VYE5_9BACT|nr:peptidoglycan DD-metalloendopeptidase family protein [Bacteriovorax sp. PP10]MEA9358089.1 peptidoglycan DD-metalloendopeptidase family protein [Bacteriovorax sp. PP10]